MFYRRPYRLISRVIVLVFVLAAAHQGTRCWAQETSGRERTSINDGWRFFLYPTKEDADSLIYDVRPDDSDAQDDRPADAEPTARVEIDSNSETLKKWILPTGNDFLADPSQHHIRPDGDPGNDFEFVQSNFDDSRWRSVELPHDWAISGPFMKGSNTAVGGGMGRLPSPGVAWYRRKLNITAEDAGKSIFLDVDGAMSYSMVWLNGHLVGGWPFGYASWRVDLTPYLKIGGDNQLAIRLDNPPNSSRWYPGGGIYRNVWLTKTNPVHVSHWGTCVTTRNVTKQSAQIELSVSIDNNSSEIATVSCRTEFFELDAMGQRSTTPVASIESASVAINANDSRSVGASVKIENPNLWGPPPTQTPNRYVARTELSIDNKIADRFDTRFGIRDIQLNPEKGVLVNGEPIYIQGVNQHHDLGALGAAFNVSAAQRQLVTLQKLGCNAIRMAHNPPAPELLELTDRMGFLVVDELFDSWERKKTPLDFHLIYPDWHEQELRALIRRDRNHPSVIMWSIGNEVGEQFTDEAGAKVAIALNKIAKSADPTRPTTVSMNYSKPDMPFSAVGDVISLNYQGEGIRDAPAYSHLVGIRTSPLYPAFRKKFPDKLILSSENAAALSSRGEYLFPVATNASAPIADGAGGDPKRQHVSAYELYTAPFGSSAEKVFRSLESHPYVGGGFVWSGWDYLGEPTPYYGARSSYFGVIDLAGFPKDRFYLYQSQWRPDHPLVHILPHWNWPDRIGKVTPVHVFTSGDEVELFLNGVSLGRKKKAHLEYRLRWDDVVYKPGQLTAKAFKKGIPWAEASVSTTGKATNVELTPDRTSIETDGKELCFITATIKDEAGRMVPNANHSLTFTIDGPGEIVATDNGDPTCMIAFPSATRPAFNGLALAIVKAKKGETGTIRVTASSEGLALGSTEIQLADQLSDTGAVNDQLPSKLDGGALHIDGQKEKPRVIVSTDVGGSDPDDFQSLVHMLLYSDVIDIEGLISSPPHKGRANDIWEALDAYANDYAQLKGCSTEYPNPNSLRTITKQGAIDQSPLSGWSNSTDGSRWIVQRAKSIDKRPLWILVWGSITDVAQAVHDDPTIKTKIRVYSIGSWNTKQDSAARDYLFNSHPDLWWIENDTTFRGMYMGGLQDDEWGNLSFVQQNVKGHGSLGELFFRKKRDIKMGDTPSLLYLLHGNVDDPTAPHWGGAFLQTDHGNHYWTDNPARDLSVNNRAGAKTVNKWRREFLDDWKRRMDRVLQ